MIKYVISNSTLFFTERIPFKGKEMAVTSGLSVNGRLFIAPREHIDSLVRPIEYLDILLIEITWSAVYSFYNIL